jgi:hypothetical protein
VREFPHARHALERSATLRLESVLTEMHRFPFIILGWIGAAVLIVAAVAALAVVAGYYFSRHQVPAGQPPLAELTGASLESLKADFNQSAAGVRIILLLSPT